jgi:hypothetical protein
MVYCPHRTGNHQRVPEGPARNGGGRKAGHAVLPLFPEFIRNGEKKPNCGDAFFRAFMYEINRSIARCLHESWQGLFRTLEF